MRYPPQQNTETWDEMKK